MKNIIKKMFSLLLVGVVAVSMFGFIVPNRVDAAEADINSGSRIIVNIESRAKFFGRIRGTISKNDDYDQIISIDPRQPRFRSPSINSFCVPESKNTITLNFNVYSPSGRRGSMVYVSIKLYKREKSITSLNSKEEVETISIKIEKSASVYEDLPDGWTVVSKQYVET